LGDAEVDQILDYLYPALANEIEQLKEHFNPKSVGHIWFIFGA
jgi:hypothetical protein